MMFCRFNKLLWDCSHNNFGVCSSSTVPVPVAVLNTGLRHWFAPTTLVRARVRSCLQVGLPPASKNADTWPIKKALLGMPGLVAQPELIQETKEFMHAMLRLRYSSPLFRLPAAAILQQARPLRSPAMQSVLVVCYQCDMLHALPCPASHLCSSVPTAALYARSHSFKTSCGMVT